MSFVKSSPKLSLLLDNTLHLGWKSVNLFRPRTGRDVDILVLLRGHKSQQQNCNQADLHPWSENASDWVAVSDEEEVPKKAIKNISVLSCGFYCWFVRQS